MKTVSDIISLLYDLLFPQNIEISLYDTLDLSKIEILAVHTRAHTPLTCIAPFPYKKKLIRNAIVATKYYGHKRAALLLGEALAPHLAEELADRRMFGTFLEPILLPIPLHKTRLRERGYNQTERIAIALMKNLGDTSLSLQPNILVRNKKTKKQTEQHNKTERYNNLKNVFFVPAPQNVQGKDIILLDDVVTTGATLSSAQATLRKAGARNILCIAVAH